MKAYVRVCVWCTRTTQSICGYIGSEYENITCLLCILKSIDKKHENATLLIKTMQCCTHTRARTHARMHTHTYTHTHAHAHTRMPPTHTCKDHWEIWAKSILFFVTYFNMRTLQCKSHSPTQWPPFTNRIDICQRLTRFHKILVKHNYFLDFPFCIYLFLWHKI